MMAPARVLPEQLAMLLLLLLLSTCDGVAAMRLRASQKVRPGWAPTATTAHPKDDLHLDSTWQINSSNRSSLPVVLWHGMGDSCCSEYSIGAVKRLIETKLGVFVHSVATGSGEVMDTLSGFYGDVNDQVASVCAQLRSVPELAGGFNAVGFSQGGQFLRAVAERCQHTGPQMHTLITMGAQHQGVMNVPGCRTLPLNSSHGACHLMQKLLGAGAYMPFVRDHVVQAQYFKDPLRLADYLTANPFLPDINNERDTKNVQYATNLASLRRLVLYRFTDDDTVVPRDSAWFSFFNGTTTVPLRQQPLYREDWIGLRALDETGRLIMDEVPGLHMQFSLAWFEQHVMAKYLL